MYLRSKIQNLEPLALAGPLGLVLAAVVVVAGRIVWGRPGVVAAALGAGLSLLNLWALERLASRAARRAAGEGGSAAVAGLQAALTGKMVILLVLVTLAAGAAGGSTLLPFAFGLLVSAFALLLAGLVAAMMAARWQR